MISSSPPSTIVIPAAKPMIGEEEVEAVEQVLRSGTLTQGEQVESFEEEFSSLAVEGRHCVAVNSGTSALHLSLLAAGIGPGDEVIVPSFTFAATANAVSLTGATAVFADIEPDFFCIDVSALEARVTQRTRAVIPVHLYGHPARVDLLRDFCVTRGILLVEDAAQAHLATLNGQKVGTFGDFGCFSFYPTKNMTSGEGGMVVTGDEGLAERVRLLRNQGQRIRYHNEVPGFNNRMSDVHAAIGRAQLAKLELWTTQRQSNAEYMNSNLHNVVVPKVAESAEHVFHQYPIRLPDGNRDQFARGLANQGIGTGVYYPLPVHQLGSFNSQVNLPRTEQACREVLSLPVHPALSREQVEFVVQTVNALAESG